MINFKSGTTYFKYVCKVRPKAHDPHKSDLFFYIECVHVGRGGGGGEKIIKRCIHTLWMAPHVGYIIYGHIQKSPIQISPIHFYNNYTINDCVQMKRTELKYFGKNVCNNMQLTLCVANYTMSTLPMYYVGANYILKLICIAEKLWFLWNLSVY